MKDKIINTVRDLGGSSVTFAELERKIEGFSGDYGLFYNGAENNVLLWVVSKEVIDAFNEISEEKSLGIRSTHLLVYAIDGKVLDYPIAKRPSGKYKEIHWLPATLSISKR